MSQRGTRRWLWGVMLVPTLGAWANGDIYVGRDALGNPYFTDTPPSYHGFDLFWKSPSRSGSVFADFRKNFATYDDLIRLYAAREGVEPALVKAVIWAESAFNPKAISPMGAQGLMQIIPSTQRLVGVSDPFDPADNIAGGTRYLAMNLTRFDGRVRWAVAAYNAGPGHVEKHGGVPPFPETRAYVDRVMALYAHFRDNGLGSLPR